MRGSQFWGICPLGYSNSQMMVWKTYPQTPAPKAEMEGDLFGIIGKVDTKPFRIP
jgi:hypothetical protein